jgi:hypothetical protein
LVALPTGLTGRSFLGARSASDTLLAVDELPAAGWLADLAGEPSGLFVHDKLAAEITAATPITAKTENRLITKLLC